MAMAQLRRMPLRGAAAALGGLSVVYLLKRRFGQETMRRFVTWMDPIEPSDEAVAAALLDGLGLDDVEAHIQEEPGTVVEGAEWCVAWAEQPSGVRRKTPLCVVFLHGWSASRKECDPVPRKIAEALKANLYYNRLPGHGRKQRTRGGADLEEQQQQQQQQQQQLGCCGEAMVEDATPRALFASAVDALRIGLALGDRVVLVGCSTGGALVTWLASLPCANRGGPGLGYVAGVVLVSPAYALAHPLYPVLKHSFANLRALPRALNHGMRAWLIGAAVGKTRVRPSLGPAYDDFNTLSYPTTAILHLLDTLWCLETVDFSGVTAPVIMFGNPGDNVVDFRVKATNIFLQFGEAPKTLCCITDADHAHVIASELLSPSTVSEIVNTTLVFLRSHLDHESGQLRVKSGKRGRTSSFSRGLGSFSRSYTSMKDLAEAITQPLEF